MLYKYVLYVGKFDQSQFAYKTSLNIARKKLRGCLYRSWAGPLSKTDDLAVLLFLQLKFRVFIYG
jgi:hypothetical protein